MSKQEKKQQRIYDLLNAWNNSEIFGVSLWPPSSPNINRFDYVIWGVLENKTNTTSLQIIGLLKTVFGEEWDKMSEEFILKACRSFRRWVDTIIEMKSCNIKTDFTVLCLSSDFVSPSAGVVEYIVSLLTDKTPSASVLDITLNNLMVRLQ